MICHNFLEEVKELHQVQFSIYAYISIETFTIPIISNQRTPNKGAITGVSRSFWVRSQYILKPWASGKLRQSTNVSSQCDQLYKTGHGILCIFILGLTLKSALLLFTLLSAIKPHFKKLPVIDIRIKCL